MSVRNRSEENEKRRENQGVIQKKEKGRRKRKVPRWFYDFEINSRRYRSKIPGAQVKEDALKIETQARLAVYEGRYNEWFKEWMGKTLGARTEACSQIAEVNQNGTKVAAANFAHFVEEVYLPASRTEKRSWRHDEFRASTLCQHFGEMALREIKPMYIQKFRDVRSKTKSRRGEVYSPASINHELALLSSILTMACDNDLIEVNPCCKVKKLEVDNERTRVLSYEEEECLFAQLTGRRAHILPITKTALHTGMRKSPLLSLRWEQVDFDLNTITITKGKSKNKRKYIVPMNEVVRKELSALKGSAGDCEEVFTNPMTGVSLTDIKKGFVSACEDAGIEDFTFHDLRHTYASRLADKGVPQATIKELLGQRTIKMSERYTHAVVNTMEWAVEQLCHKGGRARPIFPPQSGENAVSQESEPIAA